MTTASLTLNRYRNPWADETIRKGPAFYQNHSRLVFAHRGVQVYDLGHCFDYVFAGCCIAQRSGCDCGDQARAAIDEILDGARPVSDGVCSHLTAQGLKPLSYSQYTADYAAGTRE